MRLQTIKECDLVNIVNEAYRGEKVNINAVTDDIKWLIKQAEKAERYEQALQFYSENLNGQIAKEALMGDS